MRPGEDPQDAASELRVTDRRRFTSAGDIRDESAGEAEALAEALAAPAPAAAPRVADASAAPAAEPPRTATHDEPDAAAHRSGSGPAGSGPAVYDLGIEAVFFVFYQSALIALGAAQPGGPPARVDLAEARQAIGFLRVLEEKTRGNLTSDEAATVRELLSEAQLAYVQVARAMPGGGA